MARQHMCRGVSAAREWGHPGRKLSGHGPMSHLPTSLFFPPPEDSCRASRPSGLFLRNILCSSSAVPSFCHWLCYCSHIVSAEGHMVATRRNLFIWTWRRYSAYLFSSSRPWPYRLFPERVVLDFWEESRKDLLSSASDSGGRQTAAQALSNDTRGRPLVPSLSWEDGDTRWGL